MSFPELSLDPPRDSPFASPDPVPSALNPPPFPRRDGFFAGLPAADARASPLSKSGSLASSTSGAGGNIFAAPSAVGRGIGIHHQCGKQPSGISSPCNSAHARPYPTLAGAYPRRKRLNLTLAGVSGARAAWAWRGHTLRAAECPRRTSQTRVGRSKRARQTSTRKSIPFLGVGG